jgi:putative Holliday junction resolvase
MQNEKNILAIDYGKKRWGFAFCDELRIVFTLKAATQASFEERLAHLSQLIKERHVGLLVVGFPLTLEGQKSALTIEVEKFIEKHLKPLNIRIKTVDEGLSSYQAESEIPKQKIKKGLQKNKGEVDSKAAAILLEEYLSQNID